jgi:hypothetical protein
MSLRRLKLGWVHLIHSTVALVVLVLLVLAAFLFMDYSQVNTTYAALRSDRVTIQGHEVLCSTQLWRPTSRGPMVENCYVTYSFHGHHYSAIVPKDWGFEFYVDPANTAYRMNKSTYDTASENLNGDLVLGSVLLAAAILVTAVHQWHYRGFRRRRRLRPSQVHTHHSNFPSDSRRPGTSQTPSYEAETNRRADV